MARNALLPAYEMPGGLNFQPLSNALANVGQIGRDVQKTEFEQDQSRQRMGLAQNADKRAQSSQQDQMRRQKIQELAKLASVADAEQDPTKKAVLHGQLLAMHPDVASLPPMYRDPSIGPRLLMGEARDALGENLKKAQTGLVNAQTKYYTSRANAADAKPQAAAPTADPLAGYGLDDEGNPVAPGPKPAPAYGQGQGETWQMLQQSAFPEPMRLGGPRDDIDASMRLDEGRPQPQNVRVAQSSGYVPTSAMDQAKARMFGPAGVTSPDIPGVVTDAGRNRRVDVPATREAQGQRAYETATPEQQQRFQKMRQEQQFWSAAYNRAPRAGYYYGPDGRELALTDKNFKGDRESQAVAMLNLKKVDDAAKTMLSAPLGMAQRAAQGYGNIGEIGQAYVDMKQAAMGIAYALSGKTVAVAEMKNFMDAYGPTPADSAARIETKVKRLKDFYQALITASRGGESYENAFARAAAGMGLKNPDGTPMGQPGAAAAGREPAAEDLSKLSTQDLLKRLGGGR